LFSNIFNFKSETISSASEKKLGVKILILAIRAEVFKKTKYSFSVFD
jgi:hypothetical protein